MCGRARRRPPEGALFAEGAPWRFAAGAGERGARRRLREARAEVVAALGAARRGGPRRQGAGVVPPAWYTTRCSAPTCWTPPGAAIRSTSCARSAGSSASWRTPPAADAVLWARSGGQREQIAERGLAALMRDIELPLVAVLRDVEIARSRGSTSSAWRRSPRACARRSPGWNAEDPGSPRRVPDRLAAAARRVLFEKLGLSRKRSGKTGYSTDARVLQAIRDEHEIVPRIERWRELSTLDQDLPGRAPRAGRRALAAAHDVPAGGRADRPPVEHQPEHAERPDPHRAGARSAAASRPSRDC